MSKKILIIGLLFYLLVFSLGVFAEPKVPEIPQVDVSFVNAPYIDHTQAIIGLDKGWFSDVGITLTPKPFGKVLTGDKQNALLAAGTADVISGSVGLVLPLAKKIDLAFFVAGDVFQGYAIMARPDKGYKSLNYFIEEKGYNFEKALNETISQMEGKNFIIPTDPIIKGFMNLIFEKSKINVDLVKTIILEDPTHAGAMAAGRGDFELGGVPARLSLEAQGFISIVTSFDLAKSAKASVESDELRSIFRDGWVTTKEYWQNNEDTILRLASVMFRITRFINDEPKEALKIHLPFINTVGGTDFGEKEGEVAYNSLHPFYTFEDQFSWYFDESDPLYLDYEIGSYTSMWVDKGLYKPGEVAKEDLSVADIVYKKLLKLKLEDESLFRKAEISINGGKGNIEKAKELLDKARYHYDAYNFLDAKRFAEAAIQFAK